MTVTLSLPLLYQQVSTIIEDSRLLRLMEGLPTFMTISSRSMPVSSFVRSAGLSGSSLGAAAAVTVTTGEVELAGAAGVAATAEVATGEILLEAGFESLVVVAASESVRLTLPKAPAAALPIGAAAAAAPDRPAPTPYSIIV